MDMKEKRAMIKEIAEFLDYKVRSGEISVEGSDGIWRAALEKAEYKDAIIDILDMELPEDETLRRIQRLG